MSDVTCVQLLAAPSPTIVFEDPSTSTKNGATGTSYALQVSVDITTGTLVGASRCNAPMLSSSGPFVTITSRASPGTSGAGSFGERRPELETGGASAGEEGEQRQVAHLAQPRCSPRLRTAWLPRDRSPRFGGPPETGTDRRRGASVPERAESAGSRFDAEIVQGAQDLGVAPQQSGDQQHDQPQHDREQGDQHRHCTRHVTGSATPNRVGRDEICGAELPELDGRARGRSGGNPVDRRRLRKKEGRTSGFAEAHHGDAHGTTHVGRARITQCDVERLRDGTARRWRELEHGRLECNRARLRARRALTSNL